MLRVKNGDLDAFEELVNKYKQPIINMPHPLPIFMSGVLFILKLRMGLSFPQLRKPLVLK